MRRCRRVVKQVAFMPSAFFSSDQAPSSRAGRREDQEAAEEEKEQEEEAAAEEQDEVGWQSKERSADSRQAHPILQQTIKNQPAT